MIVEAGSADVHVRIWSSLPFGEGRSIAGGSSPSLQAVGEANGISVAHSASCGVRLRIE